MTENIKSFEMAPTSPPAAVLKVIGVGGGGGNTVQHMIEKGMQGAQFYCVNTDAQALAGLGVGDINQLQIGSGITFGRGAGANPEMGRRAALESKDKLAELIKGTDMLFIAAGMGGGTGTGAAPVIAQIAREYKILTVAVVTRPFEYENRSEIAQEGIAQLSSHVDSIITIPNDKLLLALNGETTLKEAFAAANSVLYGAVLGITDLITQSGLINVDFSDVRSVMSMMGKAVIGTGIASGRDRVQMATKLATCNLLTDDMRLNSARGLLVNVSAGEHMQLAEFQQAIELITEGYAQKTTKIVIGTTVDSGLADKIKVTVVATGVGDEVAAMPAKHIPLGQQQLALGENMSIVARPPESPEGYVNASQLISLDHKGSSKA